MPYTQYWLSYSLYQMRSILGSPAVVDCWISWLVVIAVIRCLLCCRKRTTPPHHINTSVAIRLRHNRRDSVSNHRCLDWLLNRLVRRRSKKTSKLRATGLWETGDRWIPLTKGQKRGKCFLLMMLSWGRDALTCHTMQLQLSHVLENLNKNVQIIIIFPLCDLQVVFCNNS